METKVKETIQKYGLLEKGDRVIVGVSGGPDSVALLHMLHQLRKPLQLTLVAAHVNHRIRGENADEDERFVAHLARQWDIEYRVRSMDVPALARKEGLSCEDAGRQVRYGFFSHLADEQSGSKIAVAHHRDDQAETVLMNLIRGSGTEGLSGMKPIRDGRIIRPLLYVSREEIETYCREHHLESRLDESNLETEYLRNKIRLLLIPYIETHFNPQFRQALSRTAEILRDENHLVQMLADKQLTLHLKAVDGGFRFPIHVLQSEPVAMRRRLIRGIIARLSGSVRQIALTHIDSVVSIIDKGTTGKQIQLPGKINASIEYETLIIQKSSDDRPPKLGRTEIQVPGTTVIPELDCVFTAICNTDPKFSLAAGKYHIAVEKSKISLPLYVRTRIPGDTISLPGGGTSKIKNILIDQKISRRQRDRIPIVVDAKGQVIWIVGVKTSALCQREDRKASTIDIHADCSHREELIDEK